MSTMTPSPSNETPEQVLERVCRESWDIEQALRAALAERDRGVIGAQLFTQLVDLRSQLQERDRELRELHTKDRVRTTEYNILTQENRDLRSQLQAVMATLENTRSAHLQAEQEVADLEGEVGELESQLQAATARAEEAEKRIAAINGQRNVMANAVNAQNWQMFWDADKAMGNLVAGQYDHLLAQQVARVLALEAYVGELREALKECHPARVWDTARMYYTKEARAHISTETEWHDRRCRQVDAALSSQPDLTLIEGVREVLEMAHKSAWPNKTEHPAMYKAWRKIEQLLARLNPAK